MRSLLALLLIGTVAACGTKETPAPVATGPKAGPNCIDSTKDAKHLTIGEGKLAGIVLGKGKTGVVLAHQSAGSICQWLPAAHELVTQGYLVLAFDFGGMGGSRLTNLTRTQEITDAVNAIRTEGATKVVLVGASMGGTYSVAAAAAITPPVQAVVSLSAPAAFGEANAEQAASKLTMPVLWVAGANEATYSADAEKMHKATTGANSKLLIAAGSGLHGVSLVTKDVGPQDAINAFATFLAQAAPPA